MLRHRAVPLDMLLCGLLWISAGVLLALYATDIDMTTRVNNLCLVAGFLMALIATCWTVGHVVAGVTHELRKIRELVVERQVVEMETRRGMQQ